MAARFVELAQACKVARIFHQKRIPRLERSCCMTFTIEMAHPPPPTHTHRVLLITTSHAQGASPTQLAVLHSAFTSSNVDVTIASLAGGTIPLHQEATTTKAQKELNKRFTSDENVALVESKPAWTFDGRDFDGFVLCGGPGALHDFVDNFGLRRLLQPAIAVGRPVATGRFRWSSSWRTNRS